MPSHRRIAPGAAIRHASHSGFRLASRPAFRLIVMLAAVIYSCTGDGGEGSEREVYKEYGGYPDFNVFLDPPGIYRSFPFYSLNGKLEPDEIAAQIRGFADAGFGGFYLHARTGLKTEYTGDEWWQCIDAAVEEAGKLGLHAWFYDEYNWPSGYANGTIPSMGKEYRAKCLARLDRNTPLPEGSRLLKQTDRYRFIEYTMQMGEPGFYGTAYVDLLDPGVVREFINQAYEPYTSRFPGREGEALHGIFSDEPHIHARYFDPNTPDEGLLGYSPAVASRYAELCGHVLEDDMELLFEEKGNWREVRLRYHQSVALQFERSFSGQISEYCEDRGYIFTGHFLGEDVLQKVRDRIGNAMLHYRNMQQPGMDHLGLTIANRIITAKSLSSVANQYGKPRRLSEIFGISGQNMSFGDRKWIAGWHAILGVNHYCPHISLYSMEGLRKRDYPPTFSSRQPYWEDNHYLEEYLGRVSYATSVGRYDPRILVINPLESEYIKADSEGEFSTGLMDVLYALQEAHYDYDLGDEQIMADTAFVDNGRLHIGEMSYEFVILPDMLGIRRSTLELLEAFAASGGRIFNCGRFPFCMDGIEESPGLSTLRKETADLDVESLADKLPDQILPRISIRGKNSERVWTQIRKTEDGPLILLYNTSHTEAVRFNLISGELGKATTLWDPSSSKCYDLLAGEAGSFEIEIAEASIIFLGKGGNIPGNVLQVYSVPAERSVLTELDGEWDGKRLDPNFLTLDFAQYSLSGHGRFSAPEPVIGIMARLSDEGYRGALHLRYPANIQSIPGSCGLVVENPGSFSYVRVNGREVEFGDSSNFLGPEFKITDVAPMLKKGVNYIDMSLDFVPSDPGSPSQDKRYGTEIESIYLSGDFGVEGSGHSLMNDSQRNRAGNFTDRPVHGFCSFALTGEKKTFKGDLCVEGYPFYAGKFRLSQGFRIDSLVEGLHYFFELPNTESISCSVRVNGKDCGTLCWAPYRTEITGNLRSGTNTIELTLANSLRNLLGPHHHPGGELIRVGPNSFTGAGGFPDPGGDPDWYDRRKAGKDLRLWTDTYYLIPFGHLSAPRISVCSTQNQLHK